jgi:nucleoside phosphorylase|tara:strand:- start:319 stop:1026 length:708 start_codon:yes stop_codon:yes gene_type:complete
MEQELTGLRRELLDIETATGVHPEVEFRVLGVGPERAGASMTALLDGGISNVDGVLVVGVAGGVDPQLETGDLLLADRYALQNGAAQGAGQAIRPNPQMLQTAQQAALDLSVPIFDGGSLTVDHLVAEPQERQELLTQYQINSVNMEDYRAAEVAQKAGVPFLSVRVVFDTASQVLPGYLPGLAKSRYKVFTNVILKPWRIPMALRLKGQLQLCQAVLTNFGLSYLRVTGIIGTG